MRFLVDFRSEMAMKLYGLTDCEIETLCYCIILNFQHLLLFTLTHVMNSIDDFSERVNALNPMPMLAFQIIDRFLFVFFLGYIQIIAPC